jgi:uncharacterized repeat protein (TIGR01451 family)
MLRSRKGKTFVGVVALFLALATWQVSVVLAQAPMPNPLAPVGPGGNPEFAPVAGADLTKNGPAASVHGDPMRGRQIFAENCAACHNDRGIGNIPNPGSDDGTVPPLNPIDPGFLEQSHGDPAQFAQAVDLFVQHGSRPAGDSPQFSMIPWGDQHLLTQQQIADVESYVMQLNGVYWSDRWAPPAEVRIKTTQIGDTITYELTVVNHGSSTLGNLDLQDTLPAGLSYVDSGLPAVGQNPARLDGSTVKWNNLDGVPTGGTLGPFVVVAKVTGSTVPSNVAQLFFSFATWDGVVHDNASTVSAPARPAAVAPAKPTSVAATPSAVATPSVAATVTTTNPASTPAATATPQAVATATAAAVETPVATSVAATAQPTSEATQPPTPTPTTAPPTPTPPPAAPTPATFSDNIVQPGASALAWGYDPSSLTIHVGDSVVWTNQGSIQHTVTADDGSFDSGLINSGATWTFTFTSAGTYSFHCAPHPWMKGTVVVQ